MPKAFRLKQEYQARNFALHFCIPTFMLRKINLPSERNHAIAVIADTFEVTNSFAAARLDHYEKQIDGFLFHDKLLKHYETMTRCII